MSIFTLNQLPNWLQIELKNETGNNIYSPNYNGELKLKTIYAKGNGRKVSVLVIAQNEVEWAISSDIWYSIKEYLITLVD